MGKENWLDSLLVALRTRELAAHDVAEKFEIKRGLSLKIIFGCDTVTLLYIIVKANQSFELYFLQT